MIHNQSSLYIFGGSFDPPHQGHYAIVKTLISRLKEEDEIYIIPSYVPPGKKTNPITSYQHRLSLCRYLFEKMHPQVKIDTCEELLMVPSYTEQTVRFLKSIHKNKQLILCIGDDQFYQLDKWRDPQTILEYSNILVYPRLSSINQKKPDIFVSFSNKFEVLNEKLIDISSTNIRKKGFYDEWFQWIPPKAQEYILKHKLYFSF